MKFFAGLRMSLVLVAFVCVGLAGTLPAKAEVLYVKADAAGAFDGTTWADAYTFLEDALAVAVAGDQIWVAAGTYTPGDPGARTATFQLKSGVEIYGGFKGMETSHDERDPATNLTVLSGDLKGNDRKVLESTELVSESTRSDNSYHVVTGSGADETAVLDGFIITGGNANASGNFDGGGMINVGTPASPTLIGCTFHGNSANQKGGGVYSSGGSPIFVNCTFRGNHARGSAALPDGGGGMYNLNSNPTVKDCTFRRNTTGGRGAGMYNSGNSQTIIRCLFEENETFLSPSDDTRVGGGILSVYSNTVIRECVFTKNIAGNGGGVFSGVGSRATIVHSLFSENHAIQPHANYDQKGDGGALQNYGAVLTVIHCTFAGNTAIKPAGAGMSLQNGGSSTVNNCIFWGNVASEGTDSAAQIGGTDPVHVTHSCVQGGFPGVGNIDIDPFFADPENGDYRLKSQGGRWNPLYENWTQDDATSPCIDAGDPMSQIGLEPFPNGGLVNMGAYGGTAQASKSSPLAYVPNPSDDSIHEQTWVNLLWVAGVFAVSHDVYLGKNFDDVNDGIGDTFQGNQTATFYVAGFPGFAFPDGLVPGTTYYWRIDEVNDAEPDSPWKGKVWSFAIPPKTAYNPDPADGTEFVNTNATLTWTPGLGAALHTVYFGDSFDELDNAVIGGTPLSSATYDPGLLEPGKIYYWRVDESDGVDTYKGDIWSFTTDD